MDNPTLSNDLNIEGLNSLTVFTVFNRLPLEIVTKILLDATSLHMRTGPGETFPAVDVFYGVSRQLDAITEAILDRAGIHDKAAQTVLRCVGRIINNTDKSNKTLPIYRLDGDIIFNDAQNTLYGIEFEVIRNNRENTRNNREITYSYHNIIGACLYLIAYNMTLIEHKDIHQCIPKLQYAIKLSEQIYNDQLVIERYNYNDYCNYLGKYITIDDNFCQFIIDFHNQYSRLIDSNCVEYSIDYHEIIARCYYCGGIDCTDCIDAGSINEDYVVNLSEIDKSDYFEYDEHETVFYIM